MSPISYLNLAWALGGTIAGYLGGALVNKVNGHFYRNVAGVIILVLVATGAVVTHNYVAELRNTVACQRKYNEVYRTALNAQFTATDMSSAALRDFLLPFRQGDVTDLLQRTELVDTYLAQVARADELRRKHSLPTGNPCGES